MFVPAHNDRLMSSAARVDADVLLLDIEDSVQPAANKQVARDNILRYLADGRFRGRVLYPRVNDRESGELLRDVYQLTVEGIAGFMYPKSKKGEDIYFFGKLLETIEYEKGFPIGTFKIIPLIETTGAVMNIQVALGVFFVALPFSRYMHIFTEIPLIFLRNAGLRSGERPSSYDRFQTDACSRCGICIDPCQLQRAGIHGVQAVYFLRDRRYGKLTDAVADNCLMCGRCERACPVGIEQNTLRLNSRQQRAVPVGNNRYGYAQGVDRSQGEGRVGYFAGCMTLLTPKILHAMERIFEAAGEPVWWADKDGGVCCGRPLKLSGEIDAARVMMESNRELFLKHGITTLVTSCPICLRVFREDYDLPGIEVLHHSEYIERLIAAGRLKPQTGGTVYTYHDPCELGRGCGVYDAPRGVIGRIGRLTEPEETRENALCCGSSVANLAIDDDGQRRIGESVAASLAATGAEAVVTACPLCKKAIARGGSLPVYDLSEIVAKAL